MYIVKRKLASCSYEFLIIADSTEFTIASTVINEGSNLRLPSPSERNG